MNVVISKRLNGDSQRRNFIDIKMNNNYIRFQLYTENDLSIISESTWKKIGKLKLIHYEKVASNVSSKKFQGEVICNVSFGGKAVKVKIYIFNNTSDLFGTDWITLFDLWDLPINSFCHKVNLSTSNTHNRF